MGLFGTGLYYTLASKEALTKSRSAILDLEDENTSLNVRISELESEDQRLKNKQLAETIKQVEETYKKSVSVYESLMDVRILSKNTKKLDEAYAAAVDFLVKADYASASAALDKLTKDIATEKQKRPW